MKMTECIVTTRYVECVRFLQQIDAFPSLRQFAISLDFHPQCIHDILKGKRKVTLDMMRKTIEKFDINPDFLFNGRLPMIGASQDGEFNPILSVVVDSRNEEKIVHIPIAAQAGYMDQVHDPVYFNDLMSYTFPGYDTTRGSFRSFDVSGESMEPSLHHGDLIICQFVEPDDYRRRIRDNFVYVIITRDSILVKRVISRMDEDNVLELHSDNSFYNVQEVSVNDICEVWEVKTKVSPFMQSKNNLRSGIHEQIDVMKQTISEQSSSINTLNRTIEMLLKAQRQS